MIIDLENKIKEYKFYGMIDNLEQIFLDNNLLLSANKFIGWEENSRYERKLSSIIKRTKLKKYGNYDLLKNFDWNWPKKIDRDLIEDLCNLDFIKEHTNVVLLGSSGVGKTTIAKNLVHIAACSGISSLFVEAADLLDDLLPDPKDEHARIKLDKYIKPDLLVIDEVGYLSYTAKHADILFQLINKRVINKSTIITTNRPFGEWNQLFPDAATVNAFIDRIIERCEVIQIEGETYRGKKYFDFKKMKEEEMKLLKV